MGYFSEVWGRVFGNKRGTKPAKKLKERSLRIETLEDRALLSVTLGPTSSWAGWEGMVNVPYHGGGSCVEARGANLGSVQRALDFASTGPKWDSLIQSGIPATGAIARMGMGTSAAVPGGAYNQALARQAISLFSESEVLVEGVTAESSAIGDAAIKSLLVAGSSRLPGAQEGLRALYPSVSMSGGDFHILSAQDEIQVRKDVLLQANPDKTNVGLGERRITIGGSDAVLAKFVPDHRVKAYPETLDKCVDGRYVLLVSMSQEELPEGGVRGLANALACMGYKELPGGNEWVSQESGFVVSSDFDYSPSNVHVLGVGTGNIIGYIRQEGQKEQSWGSMPVAAQSGISAGSDFADYYVCAQSGQGGAEIFYVIDGEIYQVARRRSPGPVIRVSSAGTESAFTLTNPSAMAGRGAMAGLIVFSGLSNPTQGVIAAASVYDAKADIEPACKELIGVNRPIVSIQGFDAVRLLYGNIAGTVFDVDVQVLETVIREAAIARLPVVDSSVIGTSVIDTLPGDNVTVAAWVPSQVGGLGSFLINTQLSKEELQSWLSREKLLKISSVSGGELPEQAMLSALDELYAEGICAAIPDAWIRELSDVRSDTIEKKSLVDISRPQSIAADASLKYRQIAKASMEGDDYAAVEREWDVCMSSAQRPFMFKALDAMVLAAH